ncbi:MAG: T9SS type A sorting domain-containing protein [Ginsengibacter sp.]
MRKFIYVSSLLFLCSPLCFAQSGKLDPLFGNQGIAKADMGSPFDNYSNGRQVLVQPGGSIFIVFNNPTFISKRLADGSIDTTYGFSGYSRPVSFDDAYAALQPDGKIVIAGSGFSVARINTNGMPDSSFGDNGVQYNVFPGDSYASSVAVQNDGKIVVAGTTGFDGDTYFGVARYTANGSPDNSFHGNGNVLTDFGFKVPPDRGGTDSVPIHIQSATALGIQADGKIVVGGYASNGLDADFAIARYSLDGTLDASFDNDGRQTTNFGAYDNAYSLAIQSDGKIVLAGYTYVGPNYNFAVVRYNINGTPDPSFNGNGKQTANLGSDLQTGNSVAIQSDDKIVVAGYTITAPDDNDFAVVRFNTNGSLDNTFDNDGMLTTDFSTSDDYAGSIAIQSDNKILVAGYSYVYSPGLNAQHVAVSRYNTNGSLDDTFADHGKLEGDSKQGDTWFNTTAIQTDGKIVAAGFTWNGSNYDFAVARFNINGTPDSTFSDDGKQVTNLGATDVAYSMVIQPDGKIVVAGNSKTQFAIARYNINGSLDNTFSGDGKLVIPMGFADACKSVALQNDGKIVLVGYTFTDATYGPASFAVARLNANGTLDNTFNGNGKQLTDFEDAPSFGTSVAISNEGKIVVGGRTYLNNQDNFSLVRFNNDGGFDTTFSHDGKQTSAFDVDDYFLESLAIQSDGKIVAGGFSETSDGSSSSFAAARYATNGDLDNSFSDDGFQSTSMGPDFNFGTSVAVSSSGRIAIGGTNDNFAIILYKNDGTADSAFGIDGIQMTPIGTGGSSIQSMVFSDNKLYAAGNGLFPGRLGVVARYLLAEGGVLPVGLLDFTGVLQNKSVKLEWKIITEKALTGFVIERSADGNKFSPINSVKVNGISSFTRNYAILDDQPLPGINFYRLKMVDIDGKFTYSNVIAIKTNAGFTLQVFPNPATTILFVGADGNKENATVQIVDAVGRVIRDGKIFLNGKTSFSVDVNNLPGGFYNLILHKKDKTETQKFIKR